MQRQQYVDQVTLLLDCLPALKEVQTFALKGGTAINFFINDLPRLSVDLDLTYLNWSKRDIAMDEIQNGLQRIENFLKARYKNIEIKRLKTRDNILHKIVARRGMTSVKIEPNFTLRGTLFPTSKLDVVKAVEDQFEYSVSQVPVLSVEELYAGKICAALSRQHPRDLFDIKELFSKQGLTDSIRQAFVIYLACAPRPMHELLQPHRLNLQQIYENEFVNMTTVPVSLDALMEARETLIASLARDLTQNEKGFILSIKSGRPDYTLMPFKNLEDFPALKWKLLNIARMDKHKHKNMLHKLSVVLEQ